MMVITDDSWLLGTFHYYPWPKENLQIWGVASAAFILEMCCIDDLFQQPGPPCVAVDASECFKYMRTLDCQVGGWYPRPTSTKDV